MKEILEILNEDDCHCTECKQETASEIEVFIKENYVEKEFARWLAWQLTFKHNHYTGFWESVTVANYTDKDVYQYWLTNIKDK
jgi:hypothetical protein